MVDWPHAPLHRIDDAGAYFITAGTYGKEHCFRQPARLDYLRDLLFDSASRFHVEVVPGLGDSGLLRIAATIPDGSDGRS